MESWRDGCVCEEFGASSLYSPADKACQPTAHCAAAKCQTDPRECLPQAAASSRIVLRYSWQAFGKDAARAVFIDTEESSCLKENVRRKPCPGQIGEFTSVVAVHPR